MCIRDGVYRGPRPEGGVDGAGEGEAAMASETGWKTYNQQMIEAARLVISAADNKDEEALSAAGNDALYPPCESCHQQYQAR